jgi:DNA-binding LytR/AlgR family response regulator
MIRVLAIDDEPLALQQLTTYIQKVPFLELAAPCQSALEARDYLEHDTVDAIFCDINMPDLNGMDFVKQLAAPPLVVFTTAYAEYAVEGFRVNAVDYLLKPFGLQDFMRAANRLRERCEIRWRGGTEVRGYEVRGTRYEDSSSAEGNLAPRTSNLVPRATNLEPRNNALFVKTDYRTVKIDLHDIRYIEGMSEYLKIHLDSQPKPVITLLAMKVLMERLPKNFMRIHRSYIVNLDKIVEVNKNRVIIAPHPLQPRASHLEPPTPEGLPIGDSYRDAFNEYLESRYLGK